MKSSTKKTAPRRRRASRDRSRTAEKLMETYRQLGFVYSGYDAPLVPGTGDNGLAPVDFRPSIELTFSALSVS